MFEEIRRHHELQKANILRGFGINSEEELELEIFKAEESDIEKAKHQDGDMHPNGKWVWVASANGGKGDWRTHGGKTHKSHSEASKYKQVSDKVVNNLKTYDRIKKQHGSDVVLLFPVGDFYHVYRDDAKTLNDVISTLTFTRGRNGGKVEDYIGFPSAALGNYIQKLHQAGKRIATLSSAPDNSDTKSVSKQPDTKTSSPKLTSKEQVVVDNFMDKVLMSSREYSDPTKVTISKTPKGNWYTQYDGKKVATIGAIPGFTAKLAKKAGMTVDDGKSVNTIPKKLSNKDIKVTELKDGGLYTRFDSKTGRVTVGSKQYNIDWDKESLVHYPSGVKVRSNDLANERFKKLLDENRGMNIDNSSSKSGNASSHTSSFPKIPKGWEEGFDSSEIETSGGKAHQHLFATIRKVNGGYKAILQREDRTFSGNDTLKFIGAKVFKTLDEAVTAGNKFIKKDFTKVDDDKEYDSWEDRYGNVRKSSSNNSNPWAGRQRLLTTQKHDFVRKLSKNQQELWHKLDKVTKEWNDNLEVGDIRDTSNQRKEKKEAVASLLADGVIKKIPNGYTLNPDYDFSKSV